MNRRKFIHHSATIAALGAALGSAAAADRARPRHPIIDTHTHFYDPTRPQGVPWPNKDDKVLYRRVMPEEYKALARPLGVTGTVVVEASSWLEDNQWVLDLAAKEKFLVGLVGHLAPGSKECREQLKRFSRNPLFRGIRIDGDQLQRELSHSEFLADLNRLADLDLELDVNGGPDMLPAVGRLGMTIPSLRIVINHVSNVRINGQAAPADWLKGIQSAGQARNVFCKVSGLVEGTGAADGQAPGHAEFYRPILDAVWNAFGEDRVIYGSNWPVSERFASYATVLRIVSEYFSGKGSGAAEKYFWRNALAVYKWVQR